LSLLLCHLASCAWQEKAPQLDPFAAINPMQKFNPLAPDSPLAATVVAGWQKEFSQPDFLEDHRWHTEEGRNELVYRLIFVADYRFFRFEGDLMAGRAAGDTVIDMAVLGLSAAGALTTPGQVTQILAAISGGLIGSRAALQKNFFQNQATAVLLDRMRALRKERYNAIIANLQQPYKRYPIEMAIVDIFDYYNRGTMLGALQDISNTTAIKQIQAEGGVVTPPPTAPAAGRQERLAKWNPEVRGPRSGSPAPTPPEIKPGEPSEAEIRTALTKSLANQNNNPDADVYKQILLDQKLDPTKIPGKRYVTKVFEAYKNYPNKRQAIAKAIADLPQSQPSEDIIPGAPTVEEMRIALTKSVAKQNNDPNADAYNQILNSLGFDPTKLPGRSSATKILEAYKANPNQRPAIADAVSHLAQ
jgi:hypothetical protein